MGFMGIGLADVATFLSSWRLRSLGLKPKLVELDNGSTIHCWIPDKGKHGHKPNLLLIHGFGGDGTLGWSNQIPALAEHFALYIPDLLFFGQSYTTNKERSEIFQAQCLLQLLQIEGVIEVAVLGTSYGGFVALHMAHLAPHLVKKVVLASSGICMDQADHDQLLVDSKCSDILDLLIPKDLVGVKNAINYFLYKPLGYIPRFLLGEMLQRFNVNREERIRLLQSKCIGSKNSPALPVLEQEVLIIWGSTDRMFLVEQAYKLQRHLSTKSTVVVIPKTGHAPQIENPTEFNNNVYAFLTKKMEAITF